MKKILKMIILSVIGVQLFSCSKKNDEEPKTDYVIAGRIYEQGMTLEFNDSLKLGSSPVDLNNDSKIDLELNSGHTVGSQSCFSYYSNLNILNSCEILTDSLDYTYRTTRTAEIKRRTVTPKILNDGDTIGNKGSWISDRSISFCYNIKDFVTSTGFVYSYTIYQGWNGLKEKYLGYRIITPSDTTYGWLSLEVTEFSKIFLGKSSIK